MFVDSHNVDSVNETVDSHNVDSVNEIVDSHNVDSVSDFGLSKAGSLFRQRKTIVYWTL